MERLGVIGGMGPEATSYFYDQVIAHTAAERDQDHIDMVVLSHASMPDRTRAILTGETGPLLDAMRADTRALEALGCAHIAIPCNYCMPCPQGINIPGCFSAYNASFAHGWFTGLSQYFTASAIRTSEPKLVSNCVRCGACARHCPQHIDIPARLEEVARRFQPGPVGWALRAWSHRG